MSNKTIFITGGSSGFGKAICKQALKNNYNIVTSFRNQEQVEEFNNSNPKNALAILMDVTDKKQIESGVRKAIAKFSKIDVLINNAGMGLMKLFETLSKEDFDKQFSVNVYGLLNLTNEVLPYMRKEKSGHIYNFSSVAGITGMASLAAYSASKFSVEGMSLSLREEVKDFGINVTLIEPGAFDTSFLDNSTVDEMKKTAPEEYEEVANKVYKQFSEMFPTDEAGDADKLAQVLLEAIKTQENHTHIPMGKDAIETFKNKIKLYQEVVDKWEATSTTLAKKDKLSLESF